MSGFHTYRAARFLTNTLRRTVPVVAGIGLCCLCLSAPAIGGQPKSGPVQLRLKFPPGNVRKYRNTLQVTITAQQTSAPKPVKQAVVSKTVQQSKVTRSLPNGGGEITTTLVSQESTIDGKPVKRTPSTAATITTYSALGKVLSVKRPTPSTASAQMSGENAVAAMLEDSFLLPSQAVKPGDTWTQTVRAAHLPGVGTATVHYRFVKIEMANGYRCARIHSDITLPYALMIDPKGQITQKAVQSMASSSGTAQGAFDTDIAIAEGKTIHSTGKGTITLTIKVKPGTTPGPTPPAPTHLLLNVNLAMDALP